MDEQKAALFEKIRQQFDSAPYPNIPLEQSPKGAHELLFVHNLVTPYYLRNQQLISTEGKVILDAGCGTGYKSLVLAEANPGAKIVGVDLSKEAIALAKQRLSFYGFENTEFIVASIEDLPSLGLEVDYINCDEVLYLLPDIAKGLAAMKAVLKPDGIIRANLHSATQRFHYFRAQQMFKIMGLMDGNPEEMEIEIARDTMKALKDDVNLKALTWNNSAQRGAVEQKEWVLMNYLFQGDKGYTIADLFAALNTAGLDFINMVNWRQWELLDLFKDADDLPAFWAMSLPEVPIEQRLQLFELMHPIHRLLDFWCGHLDQAKPFVPVEDWSETDWDTVTVHLHPQLKTAKIRDDLVDCIEQREPFVIGNYIPSQSQRAIYVKVPMAACLLLLWEGPQTVQALADRWLRLNPVNAATMEPTSPDQARKEITTLLATLEVPMYVLLERA